MTPVSLSHLRLEDHIPGAASPREKSPVRIADSFAGDFRTLFHPAVAAWFAKTFRAPTAAQAGAWPAIKAGRDTLIAAPTGSGKTLSAFLAALDDLVRQGLDGTLHRRDPGRLRVAAEGAVERHPSKPRCAPRRHPQRIEAARPARGPDPQLGQNGDTGTSERARMIRKPPHILVTTPESLYVLLGSESGRKMLAFVRSVVV